MRAGAGRYVQFPDFEKVLGISGGTDLRPEQAHCSSTSGSSSASGLPSGLSATLYDREERDMLRRPGAETRVAGGRVVRGVAVVAIREPARRLCPRRGTGGPACRSPGRGISGWISYAYARNRYRDTVSGETFWGDSDQRHTLNAYAMYRHSDRASFVAKLRDRQQLSDSRLLCAAGRRLCRDRCAETARGCRSYSRLDLRANRAFTWSRRRLTLFAEVINVLNRDNVRFNPPGVNTTTRVTSSQPFDSMLPIVPSVGSVD